MAKGPNEAQLESIVTADDWSITNLSTLAAAVDAIASTMKKLASGPGWKGRSADDATAYFFTIAKELESLSSSLEDNSTRIAVANGARDEARSAYLSLPDATVPEWVQVAAAAAGSIAIPIPPLGLIAANEAVQLYQNYMEQQRDAAAAKALATLKTSVNENRPVPVTGQLTDSTTVNTPGDGGGAGSGGGAGGGVVPATHFTSTVSGQGGSHSGSAAITPPIGTDPGHLAIDGGGPGGGAIVGTIGGGAGSGAGVGLAGGGGLAGAGTGGLAAGAAGLAALGAASRLGGGGFGATGASAQLGTGGLLGSSGRTAAAGAAAEESETESGAGARPGSSMMGSPGGAGGSNKEKRAGLGGFIAPKLEDDEERGPRSAAALAGSRDSAQE